MPSGKWERHRLLPETEKQKRIREAHDQACKNGEDSYPDPETGYQVFTREALLKNKKCCLSGCRHCPYDFKRPILNAGKK